MDDCEGTDTYVTKLKEVFDDCDTTGSGCLNKTELLILCEKLHLTEHAGIFTHHLLENDYEVKFDDFKECFVAVLTQVIPSQESLSQSDNITLQDEDTSEDREISPKFILGRKQYGRRSRPASIIDENNSSVASLNASYHNAVPRSPFEDTDIEMSNESENNVGKRPMSPCTSQQPPMKSGRKKSSQRAIDHDLSNPENQQSDLDTDCNNSFNSNPVQYLQETWKKLNIGQSGYLNVEELALVCEHIGMDMTDEVIAQLFEKLDCDQDGQISFDEFLQGLFQHEKPQNECVSPVIKSDSSKTLYNDGNRDDQLLNSNISGIFSCIDLTNTGFADAPSILELWESLELQCPPRILEELGFNSSSKINLADLTSVLEDVLSNVLKRPLLQLAFASFQNELQYLRQIQDQMQNERDKLRINIEEANARAALLAQEVDDNHAKLENSLQKNLLTMEKKYQEQIRDLMEELRQERESLNSQTTNLKLKMQKDNDNKRKEDAKLKSRLGLLLQDNQRLEQELHEASEKYLEAEKLNEMFQKELLTVPDLKEKLAILESHFGEMQEQNFQNVQIELESQKKINQDLQDKVDELMLEIQNMHQNSGNGSCVTNNIHRNHSWRSDYKKATVGGYKHRGSGSSSDDVSDAESPLNGKWRKTLQFTGKSLSDKEDHFKQIEQKKSLFSVSSVDTLLRDMMLDQSTLHRKLQVSEEKRLKAEKSLKMAEHKNKILSDILSRAMVT